MEEKGLKQSSDEDDIRQACMKAMADNPEAVEDYRNGKDRALGFLVGCVMKDSKGKMEPKMVRKIMGEELSNPLISQPGG